MTFDLTIELESRPGALADVGEAMADAGINCSGAMALTLDTASPIHLLIDDVEAAKAVLSEAGIPVTAERPVLLVDVVNKPGELGAAARKLADAGVNIELFYLTADSKMVFGVDDFEAGKAALGG